MVVAIDDLPPLLWHTELGQSMEDVWTGTHHRGAQLNRLDYAYRTWTGRYGQLAYLRQFDGDVTRAMEDELLRVIAEYNGRPFPKPLGLARRWLAGRFRREATGQAVFCAQLLAITFDRMGLLDPAPPVELVRPGALLERRPPTARRRRQPRRSRSPSAGDPAIARTIWSSTPALVAKLSRANPMPCGPNRGPELSSTPRSRSAAAGSSPRASARKSSHAKYVASGTA